MITAYLDPGETTGYATWNGSFQSGQLSFQETGQWLDGIARMYGPELQLGWEAFMITPRTALMKGSHWAVETIGLARYFALRNGATILPCYPSSSLPEDQIKDRQLKNIGWHTPGRIHANDASHHLMKYLLSCKQLPSDLAGKIMQK